MCHALYSYRSTGGLPLVAKPSYRRACRCQVTPRLKPGACSGRRTGATIGRLTGDQRDIHRSIVVRVAAESTLLALKGGLALTIGTFTMPTDATGLARKGRVNQPNRYASPGCFVGQKQAQLEEGPGVPFITVFAPNRDLLSQTGQVFKGECLARDDGFVNQGLRYLVVDMLHIPAFPPAQLFQAAFRGECSHPLQSGATGDKATADQAHLGSRKLLARAIGGNIHNAQVYSNGLFRRGHIRGLLCLGDMQEIGAVAPHQFCAADLPGGLAQHVMLSAPWEQPGRDTSLHGIERDAGKREQAIGTRIIAETGAWPKLRAGGRLGRWYGSLPLAFSTCIRLAPADHLLCFLSTDGFDRFHRLCAGADRQLCPQAEAGTSLPIHAVMRRVAVGDVFIPTHSSNPGGGLVETALRLGKCNLMACYVQFNTDSSCEQFVHKKNIAQVFKKVKEGGRHGNARLRARGNSSPCLNAGVSLPPMMSQFEGEPEVADFRDTRSC